MLIEILVQLKKHAVMIIYQPWLSHILCFWALVFHILKLGTSKKRLSNTLCQTFDCIPVFLINSFFFVAG